MCCRAASAALSRVYQPAQLAPAHTPYFPKTCVEQTLLFSGAGSAHALPNPAGPRAEGDLPVQPHAANEGCGEQVVIVATSQP